MTTKIIWLSIIYTLFSSSISFASRLQKTQENTEKKALIELKTKEVLTIAKHFLGCSYKAATLEEGNDSIAVINLNEFDCTTYVETVLALKNAVKLEPRNLAKELTKIRYRNCMANGYSSRLHYFSEWILDNEKKGYIIDITKNLGGIPETKTINFMTKHKAYYPQLKDKINYTEIKAVEKQLSKAVHFIIPKEKVRQVECKIENGNIIALRTTTKGLDFVHLGFAIHSQKDNRLHLLHASSKSKKVVVSEKPLYEYIKNWPKVSGIVVLKIK